MELRHVRYFVAVAEERSFTRAAERLSIAQSPLSQQIRKLERELGVELFLRSTRSVQLTHAGTIFYERARYLLASSDSAAEATRKAALGELGRLSLGFTGSATYELLPALVRAFHARNPDVSLELHSEMLTPAQVDALEQRRIDVGVLRPPVNAPGVVIEVLRDEPLVVPLASPRVSVQLALAYRAGEVSPLVRRYLETARTLTRSWDQAGRADSVEPGRPGDDGELSDEADGFPFSI